VSGNIDKFGLYTCAELSEVYVTAGKRELKTRMMKGFDKAGDPVVKSRYFQLQMRDAGYSFAAGLLPVFILTFLITAGITPVAYLVTG
jgi:hypothetical protein